MKQELKEEFQKVKNDFKNKNYKKQIANILTASRLLSPFVLIPLIYYDKLLVAFIMIAIFALTDTFDGFLARKYQAISKFGAYLDAIVDKVFALSILISLIIKTTIYNNNFYFIMINIILEFVICIINLYAFFKNLKPKSTKEGKLKTVFLFSLLGLLYLNKIVLIPKTILFTFMFITIILQIASIFSYLEKIKKKKTNLSFS